MVKAELEFWFELASPYSWLSAMRIAELARNADVQIIWRPFLLGPIFRRNGWETSPFIIYPERGRYAMRDLQRISSARGLAFQMPAPFPQHSLLAARLTLVGLGEGWGEEFARSVLFAQFGRGEPIDSAERLCPLLAQLNIEPKPALERADSAEIRQLLRRQTAEAEGKGIFGAPTFVTPDGELFWGDDRLDQALAWASARRPARNADSA